MVLHNMRSSPRKAYELRESQVSTPPEVVSLFWRLLRTRRKKSLSKVLDLGAGDARFAVKGHYNRYDGVEIDKQPAKPVTLPTGAHLHRMCAFRYERGGFDACIGNPPYVRHHDIETRWRRRIAARIKSELGIDLSGIGNLYLYFLCLALMKTTDIGLVGVVIPFEWVSRPSAKPIRDLIIERKWDVAVFRFRSAIFDGVLTTACVTFIDKSCKSGQWTYHDVLPDLTTKTRNGISGSRFKILSHAKRGDVWARRGISPGGQATFTLTEEERLAAGLWKSDVIPCATSLRRLPASVKLLTKAAFKRHFVDAEEKCWLIKSAGQKRSSRLRRYLNSISQTDRETYACLHQKPWYRYEQTPIPQVLFHSGFMKRGPKIVINSIGAQAVGSVYGVFAPPEFAIRSLRSYLAQYNFEQRVVAHAHTLRKVEVAQLNSVLSQWCKKASRNGREAT
jgi:hypothetical protein